MYVFHWLVSFSCSQRVSNYVASIPPGIIPSKKNSFMHVGSFSASICTLNCKVARKLASILSSISSYLSISTIRLLVSIPYKAAKVKCLSSSASRGAIKMIAWGLPPSSSNKWWLYGFRAFFLKAHSGYFSMSGSI